VDLQCENDALRRQSEGDVHRLQNENQSLLKVRASKYTVASEREHITSPNLGLVSAAAQAAVGESTETFFYALFADS
jgi:hypothetical protein